MYVITNRKLNETAEGLNIFEKVPSEKGPNELRLVEVTYSENRFQVEMKDDRLDTAVVSRLVKKHNLDINPELPWRGSLEAACSVYEQARKENKHILIYVHGYNNDMTDVMNVCAALEETYNVIVLAFSWPANGGGIEGYPAYLSDKRDARVSADALNRAIGKINFFHEKLTEGFRKRLKTVAHNKASDNPVAAQIEYSELIDKECDFSLNLLCHSMGNYVLKYALKPGSSPAKSLIFDNISLVAADVNNKAHKEWIDSLSVRNRLYVVINEKDFALKWSRRKPGDEQLARLGHYLKNLNADNATYLNVTDASWVKGSHNYFVGEPVNRNDELRAMFEQAFEGGAAESDMRYRTDGNYYEIK